MVLGRGVTQYQKPNTHTHTQAEKNQIPRDGVEKGLESKTKVLMWFLRIGRRKKIDFGFRFFFLRSFGINIGCECVWCGPLTP